MQVNSGKHVLKAAGNRASLAYSNNFLVTPASEGRSDNSVGVLKRMIRRQKESVNAFCITFTVKHPLFALLVRHSEWILNYSVWEQHTA